MYSSIKNALYHFNHIITNSIKTIQKSVYQVFKIEIFAVCWIFIGINNYGIFTTSKKR